MGHKTNFDKNEVIDNFYQADIAALRMVGSPFLHEIEAEYESDKELGKIDFQIAA